MLVPFAADSQSRSTPQVDVYSTYFVAGGMPFESLEELRKYLLAASNDFYSLFIRDCAAKDQVLDVQRLMSEVIAERAARRNQKELIYQFGIGSPPECPYTLERRRAPVEPAR